MLLDINELPQGHKSGIVAVIGRPNVGKSTLLNRFMGQKLAITSPKPQTTRDQLLGILTEEKFQILFLDTPGIHQSRNELGEYMVAAAQETIADADVVLWLVDANSPPRPEEHYIADLLRFQHSKQSLPAIVLGLNKIDVMKDESSASSSETLVQENTAAYLALLGANDAEHNLPKPIVHRMSALDGSHVPDLVDVLQGLLPEGPRYYPEDQITDMQTRFIAAELIREQALHLLGQEVPHSIAVMVDEFIPRNANMTYISAVIYVERKTQKGIVLGEKGRQIKAIGQAARPEIEELIGTRVYLELWVKVWEKWRRREQMLKRLGYAIN